MTVNLEEVMTIFDQPRERAKQSIFHLMRQGLTNAAAIPDVQTEPEIAAHHFLGCDNYLALINVYATADQLRKDEPMAAAVIVTMADEHLLLLAQAVVFTHGPIGEHRCCRQRMDST